MSEPLPDVEVVEMLLAALESTNAGIAALSRDVADLRAAVGGSDSRSQDCFRAIAQLAGLTHIAVAGAAPPVDVLDNPIMTRFLDSYPADGPPLLPPRKWADTIAAMRNLGSPADVEKERQYFERQQTNSSALTRAISRQLLAQLDARTSIELLK